MISARKDTGRIRLFLLPNNALVGGGVIYGPRFRDTAFEDRIIAIAPVGTADPGPYCDFMTTLKTLPGWAASSTRPVELTDDPGKIRLFLVAEGLEPARGHIRGPRAFEDDLLKPRTMIALPGAPAPKDGAFVTTLNELPDWAARYDPVRSLDHARKIRSIAASRSHP